MSKGQKISRWIANRLPHDVVYFAAIRMWGYATSGKYGRTIVPEVTMSECIRRWPCTDYKYNGKEAELSENNNGL